MCAPTPDLCNHSSTPVSRGKPQEKCPLCQASYFPEYKGTLCGVCKVNGLIKGQGSSLRRVKSSGLSQSKMLKCALAS